MTVPDTVMGASAFGKRVYKLHRSLSLKGWAVSPSESSSHLLPYCGKPIRVGLRAGPKHGLKRSVETSLWVACRQCPQCLKFRRLQWRERMEREGARAARTWFCTFTFSPILLAGILAQAHLAAHKAGYIAGGKGPGFDRYVDQAAFRLLQKFLKRLRQKGARFRYVAVFERGERTGRPHYHVLVHESVLGSCTKAAFRRASWPSPIWSAKLVDERELLVWRYVSKYLGKSLDIRPRASQSYGSLK